MPMANSRCACGWRVTRPQRRTGCAARTAARRLAWSVDSVAAVRPVGGIGGPMARSTPADRTLHVGVGATAVVQWLMMPVAP